MGKITAEREHEICAGHRVVGQGGKCEHLHGHGYVFKFVCQGDLNNIGMVIDFGVIKERLCEWLENNWDHKFLYWDKDPMLTRMVGLFADNTCMETEASMRSRGLNSFVRVPFNPTAENMAKYFLEEIAPKQLEGTGAELVSLTIEETRKCHATFSKD